MKKNNILSYFLIISIMTFVTIFAIIVVKSYDNLVAPINVSQNNSLGQKINLDLKLDVINQIESKEKYQPSLSP